MEKIRVLMIDDNTPLVEMVKEYFSDHQKIAVTISCSNGEEGLDAILNRPDEYDVVLLDLVMPVKDGMYVLDELNKRKIEKNIIVETSYNEPNTIIKVVLVKLLIYIIVIYKYLLQKCYMS